MISTKHILMGVSLMVSGLFVASLLIIVLVAPRLALIGSLVLAAASLALVFWLWMLIEGVTREPDQGNTKVTWALVILLAQWLGALLYFLVRRPRRIAETGQ